MRPPTALVAAAPVALVALVALAAPPTDADAPESHLYSYEGSLATTACLHHGDGTTCQTLLGGANTARTLASLGAPPTPYRWAGNITWGGLPTSSLFQATLVATVQGASVELERHEGPTVIAFDFHLDDHPGATGFALHIHGQKTYGDPPTEATFEHRQTFFVDGRIFSR